MSRGTLKNAIGCAMFACGFAAWVIGMSYMQTDASAVVVSTWHDGTRCHMVLLYDGYVGEAVRDGLCDPNTRTINVCYRKTVNIGTDCRPVAFAVLATLGGFLAVAAIIVWLTNAPPVACDSHA